MSIRLIPALLFLATINAACGVRGKNSAGASLKSGRSHDPAKSSVVIDSSSLDAAASQSLSVHLVEASSKEEVRNEYPFGKEIRENVSPGTYQYRVVALAGEGKVIYDSELCHRKSLKDSTASVALANGAISSQTLELAKGEEKVVKLEPCALTADELSADAYLKDVSRLYTPEAEGIGFPDLPRRSLSLAQSVINTTTVSASLGVKFWQVAKASTKLATSLSVSFRSEATLMKHAPTNDTNILIPGTDELAYEEGVAFVGQCNYSASVTGSAEGGVTLGVSGSVGIADASLDISNTTKIERATTVQALSKLFVIVQGEKAEQIRTRCKELFTAEVEESVKADLLNAVAHRLIRDERHNSEALLTAAITGPDADGVDANGHTWNVDKADIQQEGASVVTSGKLTYASGKLAYIKNLLFSENICYRIEAAKKDDNGEPEIINATYDDCDGDDADASWVPAAKEVAETIAIEAWQSKNPK